MQRGHTDKTLQQTSFVCQPQSRVRYSRRMTHKQERIAQKMQQNLECYNVLKESYIEEYGSLQAGPGLEEFDLNEGIADISDEDYDPKIDNAHKW